MAPRLTVPVSNSTGRPATLAGWLDLNVNGRFELTERAVADVPNGSTSATLSWGPATVALPRRAVGSLAIQVPAPASATTYLRLRLYPSVSLAPNAVGKAYVGGGEIEDHEVILGELPVTGAVVVPFVVVGLGFAFAGALILVLYARRKI
jgi:LPXTG-motif cell wall-anchored protein